ncbi:hypothetical protein MTO96_024597 [Rhipicephalus appendiculatus]
MADGEGRNAETVSTSTTKSARRQTALRHSAQTQSGAVLIRNLGTQARASAALSTHHNKSGVLKAVPERGAAGACDSSSCAEQARLLLRQINSTRDPCDDFYAYVCEDWALTRPLPPGAEQMSMDTILVDGYAELLAAELRENATRYPALRFLLDNCLHPQPNLFPTLCAMFLDTIRLKPWMARAPTSRHRKANRRLRCPASWPSPTACWE